MTGSGDDDDYDGDVDGEASRIMAWKCNWGQPLVMMKVINGTYRAK